MGIDQAVRELRQNLQQSQEKFAEVVGVERDAISEWELGRARPKRVAVRLRLVALARVARHQGRLSEEAFERLCAIPPPAGSHRF